MATQYLTVDHLSTKDLIRIFSKIKIDPTVQWHGSPCWNWTGSMLRGYGELRRNHRSERIHRYIYAWAVGPIPRGSVRGDEIDHLCRNRSCCNPVHLELVPYIINKKRAMKSHCKKGHPLTGDNLIHVNSGRKQPNARGCRQCTKVKRQQHYIRQKSRFNNLSLKSQGQRTD